MKLTLLVLCAGGGTSGILAECAKTSCLRSGVEVVPAAARAYGQDMDLIEDMSMVVARAQMESMKDNLKRLPMIWR